MTKTFLALSAFVAVALPNFANANDDQVPTIQVDYSDLDMRSDHDIAVLQRRLKRAVISLCGENPAGRLPSASVLNCQKTARNSAKTGLELALRNLASQQRFAEVTAQPALIR